MSDVRPLPTGQRETAETPTPRAAAATSEPSRVSLWPGVVFAMLGSQILFMLVMVYIATFDRSFAVEPDYYRQAMDWDSVAMQRRSNARLGWSTPITVSEQADIYSYRDVTCSVTDKEGQPINNALVNIIAFSHARGSERTALTLEPVGPGQYRQRMRIRHSGLWEFRIAAQRGTELYTQVQHMKIPRSGGTR